MNKGMGRLDGDEDAVVVAVAEPVKWHDIALGQKRINEIRYHSSSCFLRSGCVRRSPTAN